MNKKDLVQEVADEMGLSYAQTKRVIDTFFRALVGFVGSGVSVKIYNFGTFSKRKKPSRTGVLPTGRKYSSEGKNTIFFKGAHKVFPE